MGTAPDEPVRIVPYDASWPERFEEERRLIVAALGAWVTGGVHHVGSTAVPGLAAKPIVDVMVGVDDLTPAVTCIQLLAPLGPPLAVPPGGHALVLQTVSEPANTPSVSDGN